MNVSKKREPRFEKLKDFREDIDKIKTCTPSESKRRQLRKKRKKRK